jgi:hypothetical protein
MDNTSVSTEQWVINVTVDTREVPHEISASYHYPEECDHHYYTKDDVQDDEDEDEDEDEDDDTFVVKCGTCPICQEEAVEPKIVLECGHIFDEECFKEFVSYELRNEKTIISCPFCRACILQVEANTEESTPTPRPRPQNTVQSEQPIQNRDRQPSVLREFLMSRPVRCCMHIVIEVAIIGIILLIVYATTCNRGSKCVFDS